ncbi:substrate-binding domain-containing protein [Agromyces atrinae]|uniref:LacI family DNA-binding transcriptional regulator n=1 Tax=Agromyces atrinae TaxID=592376 RepID=A0A4Q2M737_9MICO|nr:substrate-binding domain-containing protein [Agromyces atrinae]MCI2956106.1 substrate-binding domain-containing protein [Agromyces atrinae]NYD68482.1 LacI family transcriptional regulator [Agromyces atrinae]RXZ84970.1 LacI family DNA-binding transcriptional regulator [Agromyces atrinae]
MIEGTGMRAKERRPSLAEVAGEAGVSISTVSKVVNGAPDVADSTRVRVESVLRDKQYMSPKQRSRSDVATVVVVVASSSLSSPLTVEMLRGTMRAAHEAGVELVLLDLPDDVPAVGWLERTKRNGPTAVIALKSRLRTEERAMLAKGGVPLVEVDTYQLPDSDSYSVGATNFAGGMAATQHLIGLGHRRIGFLEGVADTQASVARKHGHLAALASAGILPGDDIVHDGDFTYESGMQAAEELLGRPDRVTAIFAASDAQAAGVLEAARRAGLSVPRDLSVIGFDDQLVARMTAPQLTTIRQPSEAMGSYAVEIAQRLLFGSAPATFHTDLATELVVRDSTAPPEDLENNA